MEHAHELGCCIGDRLYRASCRVLYEPLQAAQALQQKEQSNVGNCRNKDTEDMSFTGVVRGKFDDCTCWARVRHRLIEWIAGTDTVILNASLSVVEDLPSDCMASLRASGAMVVNNFFAVGPGDFRVRIEKAERPTGYQGARN